MKDPSIGAPVPIAPGHDTSGFTCRHESLSLWLQRRALANDSSGASRSYVVTSVGDRRVVGYYALAAGSLAIDAAPARLRRNMPDPLPVVVLGRLAVDNAWTGQGIGSGLLRDAIVRSVQASRIIGATALLCHAIDDEAKAFYESHGFVESPIQPLTMMLGVRLA